MSADLLVASLRDQILQLRQSPRDTAVKAEVFATLEALAPNDPAAQVIALTEAQDWALRRECELDRAQSTVHIRKKAGRNLGNQFYSHRHRTQFLDGYRDPMSETLCGAAATQFDMSWADTRFKTARGHVECQDCLTLRTKGTAR